MIAGMGIDCATISRVEKSIQSEAFVRRVFSPEEWERLRVLPPHRKAESAAACFAAKEAFLKAAGLGLGGFALNEMAALRNEKGMPYYALSGEAETFCRQNNLSVHLSITHENGMAIAVAILERQP